MMREVQMKYPRCQAIVMPEGDDCRKPATHLVEFTDNQVSMMCSECAIRTAEVARSHGTSVMMLRLKAG